jgi:hypothetical protein
MINHRYKFIFIRLPKTGSQSIGKILNQLENDPTSPNPPGHQTARDYLKCLGHKTFYQYSKFGVIRNPWDRVVSHYFFWKSRDLNDGRTRTDENIKGIVFCKNHTFREYVMAMGRISTLGKSSDYFMIDKKMVLDHVIRFENLQIGFDLVCDNIGIKKKNLQVINRGTLRPQNKHYTEFYDDETMEIVANYHKLELEQFGYRFGCD